MPEKLIQKGVKKLFSLTRTKIRLAEEADTKETKPKPLLLVKFFSGKELKTVAEAKKYRDELSAKVNYENYENPRELAAIIFQLLDIIEGVKYKFEPKDCCFLLSENELKKIEDEAEKENLKVNILLMTKKIPYEGINLFVGENAPKGAIPVGRFPSTVAPLLNFLFHSKYFFNGKKLNKVNSVIGHKTLILNAIHFALGEFGAKPMEEEEEE